MDLYLMLTSSVATTEFDKSWYPSPESTALDKINMMNFEFLVDLRAVLLLASPCTLHPSWQDVSTVETPLNKSSTYSLRYDWSGGTGISWYIWDVSDALFILQLVHVVEFTIENAKKSYRSGQHVTFWFSRTKKSRTHCWPSLRFNLKFLMIWLSLSSSSWSCSSSCYRSAQCVFSTQHVYRACLQYPGYL